MANLLENNPMLWLPQFPHPERGENKYDRGHAVVLGGGVSSMGAAKIAARNALRVGAGLVSVACDSISLPVYAASLEAVMTKPVENVTMFTQLISDPRVTAVLIGPGAGVNERTKEYVLAALALSKPLVLDADALTVFADAPEQLFAAVRAPVILTPHEGEFKRLFADFSGSRETRAREAAQRSGAVLVLKGNETLIAASDGRCIRNPAATPYLATAGSGDALAGICLGLLAQKMPAYEGAAAAVWLHSQAAEAIGSGLIAEDIAEQLPEILKRLLN